VSERIGQARKWGSAAAAVGAAVLLAAACSSQGSSQTASTPTATSSAGTSAKVTKIAIALPAKVSDYGWNQQGVNAARAVASSSGAQLTVLPDIGYDNTQSQLSQLARQHAQFIIAHASGYDTAAKQVAMQYHVPIMTYDIPNELVPGLVSNITTSAQQGGYLAGILAAKMTKTNTIGIVISASDTNWFEMSGGFAAGVHSVNPKVKIRFAEIGSASYDDSAGGKRVAQTLMSAGADVVFGMETTRPSAIYRPSRTPTSATRSGTSATSATSPRSTPSTSCSPRSSGTSRVPIPRRSATSRTGPTAVTATTWTWRTGVSRSSRPPTSRRTSGVRSSPPSRTSSPGSSRCRSPRP
jgi:simple sugar transport system substrate-binding protein